MGLKDPLRRAPPEAEATAPPAPPATPEAREDGSVEIKLSQIAISDKPLKALNETGKTVTKVTPIGDNTLVQIAGNLNFEVYDKQARKVEDFKPLSLANGKIKIRDLCADIRSSGKTVITKNAPFRANEIAVTDLSDPDVKAWVEQHFKETFNSAISIDSINDDQTIDYDFNQTTNIRPSNQGKYIILKERARILIFQTKADDGASLSPRDWKRPGSAPADLNKEKVLFKGHIAELNEKFTAKITDNKIEIYPSDKLYDPATEKPLPPIFSDGVAGIDHNLTVGPKNPDRIYYCRSQGAIEIITLEMTGDPNSWKTKSLSLPKTYSRISDLQMDPSGHFFMFTTNEGLVILDAESMQEIKTNITKVSQANFDQDGNIRAVNGTNFLVTYQVNFEEAGKKLDRKRVSKVSEIDLSGMLAVTPVPGEKSQEVKGMEHLETVRTQLRSKFVEILKGVRTIAKTVELREKLSGVTLDLAKKGLKADEVQHLVDSLEDLIVEKQKEIAKTQAAPLINSIETIITGGLSLTQIGDVRTQLEELKPVEHLLEPDIRKRYDMILVKLSSDSAELFRTKSAEIIGEVGKVIEGVKLELTQMTRKSDFDTWMDFKFPQLKTKLGRLFSDCPPEVPDARKAILDARDELNRIADAYNTKFKEQYADIRHKAADQITAFGRAIQSDIENLIARLSQKGFVSRQEAQVYLQALPAKLELEREIANLAGQNPDMAKDLEQLLKAQTALCLSEIERTSAVQIAATGQQMVAFGDTLFPKWEAKVKVKVPKKVEIAFQEDSKTRGAGIGAKQIMGEVMMAITDSQGKRKVKLYEGGDNEDEWRLGLYSNRGVEVPASYITAAEFPKIRKSLAAWENGSLQEKYNVKRKALSEFYKKRQVFTTYEAGAKGNKKIKERDPKQDAAFQKEYKAMLEDFAKFCADNHIALLRRIDQVKAIPEIDTNGKGYVPEWNSHWVIDPDTEEYLETMSILLKMQLDLHEGVLNLKGHAGTGKDVLIKMFANRTNRPYFAIDCTKWTTESDLSEDITLTSKDGATQVISVPSSVLNGIQTPGAMVYFNEINAMPETAQIFLHALWDEKRSMTLKTKSGKTIKADPTVVMVSSMNPDYPGTFKPQFATRSRMVSMQVDYPPLLKWTDPSDPRRDQTDTNLNPPYSASEALRLARGIDSLSDLTYEPNMKENGFVKMWDHHVNKIANGSPEPDPIQKVEIETILALVQFGNKLRKDFMLTYDDSRTNKPTVEIHQPLTSRELRRCAYTLNRLPTEVKLRTDPDDMAQEMLRQFFLNNIDDADEVRKIETEMATWSRSLRVV